MYNIPVLEKYTLHAPVDGLNVWSMTMPKPRASAPEGHVKHGHTVLTNLKFGLLEFLTPDEILEYIQIQYMNRTIFALKRAKQLGARVLNLSSEFMDYDNLLPLMAEKGHEFEEELSQSCLMFAGAGNDGNEPLEHFEALAASREAFIAIGAVNELNFPRSYSSWGSGAVEFAAFDARGGRHGTSYSVAYVTGLVAGYEIRHLIDYGFLPSFDQTCKWMLLHAVDVGDIGFDLKTGFGVITPSEPNYFVTMYDVKTKEKVILQTGEITEQLIHKDICDVKYITAYYDKENGKAYYSHAV